MQSFDSPSTPVTQPSAWVRRYAGLVAPGAPVLDLACGGGRHARFFLERGHPVTAVDLDVTGVADLAGATILRRDLEADPWPFDAAAFGGIVVTNYLHRPHFPRLVEALVPGGVLIVESFGAGNERYGRPRNPDFLLAPGELLAAFGGLLEVVAFEQGLEREPRPAVRQRLVAVRGAALAIDLPGVPP